MALMRRLAVAVISTLLLVPTIQAEEATVLAPRDMIALIGIDQHFIALRALVRDGLRASGQSKDEAFLTYWESLSQTMFDPDDLIADAAAGLEGKFTTTEQSAIKTFFTSELGVKMIGVENAAIVETVTEHEAQISQGLELMSSAGETRRALLGKIASLSESETSKATSRQAFRTLLIGICVGQNRGGDIAIPWDEIDAQVDALIPIIEEGATRDRLPVTAYTYRDISDEDLAAYLAFFVGEVGLKLLRVTGDVLAKVEGDETIRFGTALAAHSDTLSV